MDHKQLVKRLPPQTWLDLSQCAAHKSTWHALLQHLASWIRLGYMPWDLKFDNVGTLQNGSFVSLDFDAFTEIIDENWKLTASKNWWSILKKIISV